MDGAIRFRTLHIKHSYRLNKLYNNSYRLNYSFSPMFRLIPALISRPKLPPLKPRKQPTQKSNKPPDSTRTLPSNSVPISIPPTNFHHKIPPVQLFLHRGEEPKLILSKTHTLENLSFRANFNRVESASLSFKSNSISKHSATKILPTLTRLLTWRQALLPVSSVSDSVAPQQKVEMTKKLPSGMFGFLKSRSKTSTTRQPAAASLPIQPKPRLFECAYSRPPPLFSYSERGFAFNVFPFASPIDPSLLAFHETIPSLLLPRAIQPLPPPPPLATQSLSKEEPEAKVRIEAESASLLSRVISTIQWPFMTRKEAAASLEASAKAKAAAAPAAVAAVPAPVRVSLSETSVGALTEVCVRHIVDCWRELSTSGALADFGSRSLGTLALTRLLAQLSTLLLEMPAAGRVAASNAELVRTLKAIHRFAVAAACSASTSASISPSIAHSQRFFGPMSAPASTSASSVSNIASPTVDSVVSLRGQSRMLLAALGHVPPPRAAGIRVLSIDGGGIRCAHNECDLEMCSNVLYT